MDPTTLWQEHKTFILSTLGGLLVFFVAQALLSTLYGVDEQRRKVQSLESSLRRTPAPPSSALEAARNRNAELKERFAAAVEGIRFVPDPRFLLSPKEKPDIQFDRLYNEARDLLVEGGKTLNILVDDSLGMPELSPTRQAEIQEALLGLDIAARVVLLAIESRMAQVESVEMVPETGRRTQNLLDQHRVRFRLRGSPAAFAEFLKRFARQDNFLAIESARIDAGDPDGSWLRAELTVAALEVLDGEGAS